MSELINVTPEHGGPTGIILRVTRMDVATMNSHSDIYPIEWGEARRLLANLVSILNGHHEGLERD